MKATPTIKGDSHSKFLQKFKDISSLSLSVGHFEGIHESGLTYVELLSMWAAGVAPNHLGVVQDVRSQWVFQYFESRGILIDSTVKNALSDWYKNILSGSANDTLLDTLGEHFVKDYKDYFGEFQGPHMAGTSTPMLETGELRDAVKYKKGDS